MIHLEICGSNVTGCEFQFEDDDLKVEVGGKVIGYYNLKNIEVDVENIDIAISVDRLVGQLRRDDATLLFQKLHRTFGLATEPTYEDEPEPEWAPEPMNTSLVGTSLTIPMGEEGDGLATALSGIAPGDFVLDGVIKFVERFAQDHPKWARRVAFVALMGANATEESKKLSVVGRAFVRSLIRERSIL